MTNVHLTPALLSLVRTTRLAALRVAIDHLDLSEDDGAGLYMEVMHGGGEVEGPEGWPAAYGFARGAS